MERKSYPLYSRTRTAGLLTENLDRDRKSIQRESPEEANLIIRTPPSNDDNQPSGIKKRNGPMHGGLIVPETDGSVGDRSPLQDPDIQITVVIYLLIVY